MPRWALRDAPAAAPSSTSGAAMTKARPKAAARKTENAPSAEVAAAAPEPAAAAAAVAVVHQELSPAMQQAAALASRLLRLEEQLGGVEHTVCTLNAPHTAKTGEGVSTVFTFVSHHLLNWRLQPYGRPR